MEGIFKPLSSSYEIHHLGTNYRGDPHGYGWKVYPAEIGGDTSRDDVIGTGAVRLAYLLRDWLAITTRFEVMVDSTDYTYMAGSMSDSPEFTRYEAYLGVSAAF